jgi:hypothetical protein
MGVSLSSKLYFHQQSRPSVEPTQPPIQWVPGALSPGVKRPGREADRSPPSTAEVKKKWSYTSITPYVPMTWCIISTRYKFTCGLRIFTNCQVVGSHSYKIFSFLSLDSLLSLHLNTYGIPLPVLTSAASSPLPY